MGGFLTQSKLKAYYNNEEGIGISECVPIDQGETIRELSESLHQVGDDITTIQYPVGMRWSFFEDSYLAGPVSLINCSCSKHRNVNMRGTDNEYGKKVVGVISEWYIERGEKLFAAYDNDITNMKALRGIRCLLCH